MMDMVERVARAILKRRYYDGEEKFYDSLDAFWAETEAVHFDHARSEARAAIEAMRETPECIAKINGSANWPKMIDAILTPSPAAALNPQSQP